MRYLIVIIALISYVAQSQSLRVFDVDATDFPTLRANFYAFDENGNQVRPDASEMTITEDGVEREILSVDCPPPKPLQVISSVLTIDVSGSMRNDRLGKAKAAAKAWVDALPNNESESAITTFNSINYYNQDFTNDKDKLLTAINKLQSGGGTDFDAGFINPMAGALLAAEKGKNKRVVVLITDGIASGNESAIIQKSNELNVEIYCVTLDVKCPDILKNISNKTGGQWFENVTTVKEAEEVYQEILDLALGGEPCEITWESEESCSKNTNLELNFNNQKAITEYETPIENVASLRAEPRFISFGKRLPSSNNDTTITLTAKNADFTVTEINRKYGSVDFSVINTNFPLLIPENSSVDITLRYAQSDSSIKFGSFEIETDKCKSYFSANGGFPRIKINNPTIKLTKPNGGETFFVGSDTPITWEGLSPTDTVSLDYSIDEGTTWNNITTKATGLEYNWLNVPDPESSQCLVRASQPPNGKGSLDSVLTLTGNTRAVLSVAYSPDGSQIASGSYDGPIKIWDVSTGTEIRTLTGHTSLVLGVAYSPDGSQIASGSYDNTIKIWDAFTGTEIRTLTGHTSDVLSVAYSPDGSQIATGSYDGTIKIWDALTGAEIRTLTGHNDRVPSVAYSPDGSQIATGSRDETIKIWDASTGAEIRTLTGHTRYVKSVAYSPDGSQIASGSYDETIKIWDVSTGTEIRTLTGHSSPVYSVAYSPDGSQIASGSNDLTIKIWDALTGTEIRTLTGHTHYVYSVAYSPDGSQIASGSYDETIKIWDVNTVPMQEDESDAVFSIVMPDAEAIDIDMQKEEVGKYKDSLINDFVQNIGSWKFDVDSIYFRGVDSDAFSLLSGFPVYTIEANSSQFAEIRFEPSRVGVHNAEIVIITQADTLVQSITGEGVMQEIEVEQGFINFGEVDLGTSKDTLQALTIKNVSSVPITITETKHGYPNDVDFSTLANGGNFTLEPDQVWDMDLRFSPSDIGRTSGVLEFYYDGVGSPAIVQLFGEGIGEEDTEGDNPYSQIAIPSYTQEAGEEFNFTLQVTDSEYMDIQGAPREFEAEISYNGSILYFPNGDCVDNFDCNLSINGTWDGISENIISIPAVATLGNTESTSIKIVRFEWVGGALPTEVDLVDGSLTIDGICEEGPVRLVQYGDVSFSMATRPQPFEDELTIQIGMRETLTFDLLLLDINGNEIRKILENETLEQGSYSFNIDTSDLTTGVYYIRLASNKGQLLNKIIKE